uniref:Major capsid protein n=1 Tax=Siphoviridae sp. ctzm5103 TaxID=2825750 RepID=A0A8S5TT59_9CAUD|nr:MAG TPA: major capsid protein [Siphoviridae sp. ctzm5103]
MPNVINYAEQWSDELLQIIDDGAYSSPFLTPNDRVKWLGAKTFHFTKMDVSGFKPHSRDGGYNRGSIVQEDKEFTLEHDRDIEFFVDVADVDESKQTANLQNVSRVFTQKHSAPETDARFFERVAKAAIADGFYETMTGFTAANTYGRLVKMFQRKELKKYRAMGGLIAYVSGEIMDYLESSTEITKTLDIKTTSINEKQGIETRIATINGVTIIEVVDDTRFNTSFDYSDGFVGNGSKINVCIAHPSMVKTVNKISSIKFWANGTHTEGDGDLYQRREYWDTFVFPNGLDGKCDAVYVNIESGDPSVRNYPTKTYNVNGQKLDASGTKAEIAAGTDTDYVIKGTGAAGAVAPAAATAVYESDTVKNNFIFMLEIGDDVTHYGRGESKVESGMTAIPAGDIKVVDGTRYLIVAKGLTADKAVYGGAYMSVGTGAAAVSKSFKIDASALVLA